MTLFSEKNNQEHNYQFFKTMTEEQLKVMADDYAAKFEPMFRKVARFAFIEGMQLGMELSKEVIEECSQQ